jgi:hypothetical protein
MSISKSKMGELIRRVCEEAWEEIKSRIQKLLNWIRKKAFGSSSDKNGKKKGSSSNCSPGMNESSSSSSSTGMNNSSPSTGMSQGPTQRNFIPPSGMNQMPKGRRSGPPSGKSKVPKNAMDKKPQNEPQSRASSSSSSYTCSHKGCTRKFQTFNEMNKHYGSRHNGSNRRNKK